MLRIRGDRSSLLAALAVHWAEQQLQLPRCPAAVPLRLSPGASRPRDRS